MFLEDFSAFGANNYHMVLAHRYLTDEKYRDFYLQARKVPASTIILDNGACELKASIESSELYQAIRSLRPDYLVLPDVIDDGSSTTERSLKFLDQYSDITSELGIKFMGVPQGLRENEWINSFDVFYTDDRIAMIGISNVAALNKIGKKDFTRVDAINVLQQKGYGFENKKVHILGMGDSGHMEIEALKCISFVEGIDTSAPVVHGYYGVKIIEGNTYKKIPIYLPDDLDHLDQNQYDLIISNLKVMINATRI